MQRIRGHRRRTTVDLRGLPRGAVRVTVVVRGVRRGRSLRIDDARLYRTSAPRSRR